MRLIFGPQPGASRADPNDLGGQPTAARVGAGRHCFAATSAVRRIVDLTYTTATPFLDFCFFQLQQSKETELPGDAVHSQMSFARTPMTFVSYFNIHGLLEPLDVYSARAHAPTPFPVVQ